MFYFLHEDGDLQGAVQTHVDDFSPEFVDMIIKGVSEGLTVSKIEQGQFPFTGLKLQKYEDSIVLYVGSPEDRRSGRGSEMSLC